MPYELLMYCLLDEFDTF